MILTRRQRGVRQVAQFMCIALLWLCSATALSQTTLPARQEWETLLADVEANRFIREDAILRLPCEALAPLIEEGLKNDSQRVRRYVSGLSLQLVRRVKKHDAFSMQIVRANVMKLKDEPDGARFRWLVLCLADLPRDAFDAEAQAVVEELVLQGPRRDVLFVLAGVVDTEPVRRKLRAAHAAGKYESLVGLARLGEPGMVDEFLRRLESEACTPEGIARRLGELLRVRRPEMLPFLLQYVNSDKATPARGDVTEFVYAKPAAAVLAQVVEGVPLDHIYSPSWEEVQKVRQWLKEHPDPKVIP